MARDQMGDGATGCADAQVRGMHADESLLALQDLRAASLTGVRVVAVRAHYVCFCVQQRLSQQLGGLTLQCKAAGTGTVPCPPTRSRPPALCGSHRARPPATRVRGARVRPPCALSDACLSHAVICWARDPRVSQCLAVLSAQCTAGSCEPQDKILEGDCPDSLPTWPSARQCV